MKILILGAGMYVTGRGGTGHGVVLSALAQISKGHHIDRVLIVARDPSNSALVEAATARINKTLGSTLRVDYATTSGQNLESEIRDLCALEKFDCAVVSTPDHLHYAPLRALLKAGVPSLVVKPFVPTLKEACELLELQHITGTYGAIEFHKRFDKSNLYARKIIDEGQLGRLLYMSVDYSQRIQIPTRVFRTWAEHTNIFQYLAVHYVDLILFLTGFKPRRLTAYGTRGILCNAGIDTFDSIHVMIEWIGQNGEREPLLSQHNSNWIDPNCTSAMSDQRFKLVGSKGRIECDQRNRGIEVVREDAGVTLINPYFSDYLPNEDGNLEFQGYAFKSIATFIEDVRLLSKGKISLAHLNNTRPSFKQALISTAVIDAVNLALVSPPAWRDIDDIPA